MFSEREELVVTANLPDSRIERLSALSARRVIDPDQAVVGHLGDGQVVANELLTIVDLDLDRDRPILEAAVAAGAVRTTRIPRNWRQLCGVDRMGRPVPA